MSYYGMYGTLVRNLIDESIENAIELIEDMDCDLSEAELISRIPSGYRQSVLDSALDMLTLALDPDHGDARLPAQLMKAVEERVRTAVKIATVATLQR